MSSEPAILLVDHGSRRPEANEQLESIAQLLRDRDPERIVRVAHMEIASPTIAEGIAACVLQGQVGRLLGRTPTPEWPASVLHPCVEARQREGAQRRAAVERQSPFGVHGCDAPGPRC